MLCKVAPFSFFLLFFHSDLCFSPPSFLSGLPVSPWALVKTRLLSEPVWSVFPSPTPSAYTPTCGSLSLLCPLIYQAAADQSLLMSPPSALHFALPSPFEHRAQIFTMAPNEDLRCAIIQLTNSADYNRRVCGGGGWRLHFLYRTNESLLTPGY